MLKKILVPLDGSALAERALTYATALADQTGARLVLLRAAISHTLPGVDSRERQHGAVQEAEVYLQDVAKRLGQRGYTCETVARYGHPAESLIESARTRSVDLIVMATHGRTGPGRWVLGSVAEAVVRASSVPVLVQRAWQPVFGEPFLDVKPKLVVPLDGSAFAESALEPAAKLAQALDAKLILVRVEDDPAAMQAALGYLPQVAARLGALWPSLAMDTDIRIGEPAHGIAEAVVRHEAALVVMATHGRGGALRTILGSVAGKLFQEAEVPVVLIRPVPTEDDQPISTAVATPTPATPPRAP
jgi:nucleotide-binding universal stress UspA family protein